MLIEASPIGPAIIEQITVRRPDLEAVLALVGPGQAALHKAVHRLAARPFGECLIYLGEAVPNWAERCGKRVELVVEGRDVPVPMELARVLPAVMTHLARNAVAHGIEPVDERQAGGKPAGGTIRVEAEEIEEELEIRFSDDGQGLRRPDIKARAAELGLTGEAEELVFAEGFSTGTATILSGRGVGLGAVREELNRASYGIDVLDTNVGTSFRIFPIRNAQSAIVSA
jgi:chemotaxis protein histidine kinase CheA